MIAQKYTTRAVALLMTAAVILCLLAVAFSGQLAAAAGDAGITMEYENALFDTERVIQVNIVMDEAEWTELLENASAEEYYACNVEINGECFYRVGIRPKGNTSLSSIVSDPTTDRYSFKLEFDQYVDGQTCFGLDKLILNNNYADATNMKEALVYDMFRFIGADAPLYNYASISVNGEYWGVYLALEAVEDSFLLRNYGVGSGALYKPEGMNMGGGKGGFSMSSGGANLNYSDDALDSYSTIWDGEVTKTTEKDRERVVTALKNIAQGTDLENYMDIDKLLRYMAVHIFAVNEDSLSGAMAHNYYLYEKNGRLNLIPWDYNLSFGGMSGGTSGTSVINEAIDDAFASTDFFDTLMDNETYHAQYYAYLSELVEDYINGGGLDAFYARVRGQIDTLVESDPTAFYTYEEYEIAAETLYQLVKLRGQSVAGQVAGTIPSTEEEQRGSDALIDGSAVNVSSMGSMMGGNRGQGMGFDNARSVWGKGLATRSEESGEMTPPTQSGQPQNEGSSTMPTESENVPTWNEGSSTMPTEGENAPTWNEGSSTMPIEGENVPTWNEGSSTKPTEGESNGESPSEAGGGAGMENKMPTMGQMPDFSFGDGQGGFPDMTASGTGGYRDALILYGGSVGVLLLALVFSLCYRRKPRRR